MTKIYENLPGLCPQGANDAGAHCMVLNRRNVVKFFTPEARIVYLAFDRLRLAETHKDPFVRLFDVSCTFQAGVVVSFALPF